MNQLHAKKGKDVLKEMKYVATLNGKKYEVEIERVDEYRPLDRGAQVSAPAPILAAAPAPKAAPAPAAAPKAAAPAGGAGNVKIEAGAAGKVFKIESSVGASVKKGDTILVLEIMKMETPVVATEDGTVASINVSVGDMVEAGALLATLNN